MESEIVKKFDDYIRNFSEAVCPFARPAAIEGKIKYVITDDFSLTNLSRVILWWDTDKYEVLIIIFPDKYDISWRNLEQISKELSEFWNEIEFFAGHPESPMETRKDPYANIQCNLKSKLTIARKILKRSGYYEK